MALFLYLISLFSLSQASIFNKLANAPPPIIGFFRISAVAIILILFCNIKKISILPKNKKTLAGPFLAGFFFFLHLYSYSFSAQNTSVANMMIIYSINPIFTAFAAFFLLKERFNRRLVFAFICSFISIYLLAIQKGNLQIQLNTGDLMAIVAAVFYAAYLIAVKKNSSKFSNLNSTIWMYLSTALCFLITIIFQGHSFTNYPSNTWLGILGLILLPSLCGHFLFTWLLGKLNINLMSCGKLLEPPLSVLTAYFLFLQPLNLSHLQAFIFSAASLLILFWPTKKKVAISASNHQNR